MTDQPVILFDGVCNLCNASVQFIIRHDPQAKFRFASLQGNTGQKLLDQYGLQANRLTSIILIQDTKVYTRSTAALRISRKLTGLPKLLYGFIIVPPFIRNAVYDIIAGYRYRWFGKKDECMVPTAALQARFLN